MTNIKLKIKNSVIYMVNAFVVSLVVTAIFSIAINVEAITLDPHTGNVSPGDILKVKVYSHVVGISAVDKITLMLQVDGGDLTGFSVEPGFLTAGLGCNNSSSAALFDETTDRVCVDYGSSSGGVIADNVLLGTMTIVVGTSGNTTVEKIAAVGTTPGNSYHVEVTVQPTVGAGTNTPTPDIEILVTPDEGTAANFAIILATTDTPTPNTTITGLPNTGTSKVRLDSGYLGVLFVLGGIVISISNKIQAQI